MKMCENMSYPRHKLEQISRNKISIGVGFAVINHEIVGFDCLNSTKMPWRHVLNQNIELRLIVSAYAALG